MPLKRYLGKESIQLLKRGIKSLISIQRKALPHWLINENCLRGQQETGKRGSALVITVKGKAEAKKLCASGL